MTDARDSCFGCGGHLRQNVYAGVLCPSCERKAQKGKMTPLGGPVGRVRARQSAT